MRTDLQTTMLPSEMTAISVVPLSNVQHHAGDRFGDGQISADRRGERLFDQVYGSRARRSRRLLDGVSLERRQAAPGRTASPVDA
jgi:hypothetical protein